MPCRLPFPDASFNHVLCVEAMFHFASRRTFFAEAARVLKPGGAMVASDIGRPGVHEAALKRPVSASRPRSARVSDLGRTSGARMPTIARSGRRRPEVHVFV